MCATLLIRGCSFSCVQSIGGGANGGGLKILLSISFLCQCVEVIRNVTAPHKQYIYWLIITQIIYTDISRFFVFAFSIFIALWGAMFAVYPTWLLPDLTEPAFDGFGWLDAYPDATWNAALISIYNLFILMTTGEQVGFSFEPVIAGSVKGWEAANFSFFMFYYLCFVVLTAIICLNLLIAMMSETYAEMVKTAELKWRVDYARRVLRLELLGAAVAAMVPGGGKQPQATDGESKRESDRTSGEMASFDHSATWEAATVDHSTKMWPVEVPPQNATTLVDDGGDSGREPVEGRDFYLHTAEIDPETGTDHKFFGFNSWYDKGSEQQQKEAAAAAAPAPAPVPAPAPAPAPAADVLTAPAPPAAPQGAARPPSRVTKPKPTKAPASSHALPVGQPLQPPGPTTWVQELGDGGHYHYRNLQTNVVSLTLPGESEQGALPTAESLPAPAQTTAQPRGYDC